jgi:hypothetical protein
VLLPFLVVPVIALVLLIPGLAIWLIAHQGHPPHVIPPAGLWLGTVVSVVVSLIVFGWAPGVAVKIARRRYDRLHGYLSDPEYG